MVDASDQSKALPSSHSTYHKTLVECGLMLAEYLFSSHFFFLRLAHNVGEVPVVFQLGANAL